MNRQAGTKRSKTKYLAAEPGFKIQPVEIIQETDTHVLYRHQNGSDACVPKHSSGLFSTTRLKKLRAAVSPVSRQRWLNTRLRSGACVIAQIN